MNYLAVFIRRRRRLSPTIGTLILIILGYFYHGRLKTRQSRLSRSGNSAESDPRPFQFECKDINRMKTKAEVSEGEQPWQYTEDEDFIIHIYSAILYTRELGGGKSVRQVKVVALGSDLHHVASYCQLWFPNENHPRSTPATVSTGALPSGTNEDEAHGKLHEYVFTCILAGTDPIPDHVSIVAEICERPETYVEIHRPSTSGIVHDFGLCMPATGGNWDAIQIVEWTEMQLLMGVSEIQVYDRNLTSRTLHKLRHYIDAGVVRVNPIPAPDGASSRGQGALLLDTMSLTDCLLRNVNRYRKLIVADFNDIIVPRGARDYKDMLEAIAQNSQLVGPESFSFRVARFPTDCYKKTRGKSVLFRYLRRSEAGERRKDGPVILDPTQCLSLSHRGCISHRRHGLGMSWDVKPEVAVTHRYQPPEGGTCNDDVTQREAGVLDKTMMKYIKRIMAVSPIKLDPWQNL